jgi:RNA polymerase sigma-70 factor (ECF subfamily)
VNSDAELVARTLEGSGEAFTELVGRHYDASWRFARQMLRDNDEAEDGVQETFLRAYRALARYREARHVSRVALSHLVNRCRRCWLASHAWTIA